MKFSKAGSSKYFSNVKVNVGISPKRIICYNIHKAELRLKIKTEVSRLFFFSSTKC